MNKTFLPNFNLELNLLSGQTFSWTKVDDYFYGSFINKIVKIKQEGNNIIWQTYPNTDDYEFIKKYFDIENDYAIKLLKISNDRHVKNALEKYSGLRILNQDFYQTLMSFILAQNKNIKAIRKSLNFFAQDNNKKLKIGDSYFYFFPEIDYFQNVNSSKMKESGVGYRAEYLKNASNNFPKNIGADEEVLRQSLKTIKGVGDKVADCVLTFSLGFHNITPIDVWGDKIIKELYKNNRSKNYDQKRKWFSKKFKENTAIAGQYLFEYIRNYNPKNYY